MTDDATEPAVDEPWAADDLEQAYRRAMETLDQVEADWAPPKAYQPDPDPDPEPEGESEGPQVAPSRNASPVESANSAPSASAPTAPVAAIPSASGSSAPEAPVSPRQILEACLFVGGPGLTSAKLANLLRGDYSAEFVEQTFESLNRQFASEGRPYIIAERDTGFILELRPEFERLRSRVYGLGPKEVRLTQDVLEVLALVAYKQPVSEIQLSELGKPEAGAVLRQLLRRELIAIERDARNPKLVSYITTPRFLSLFNLADLEDLPQISDLKHK